MKECKIPLRIILQNFINTVESLESKTHIYEEVYDTQFQELKKLTESLKNHPDSQCLEGEKEVNRRKNRYKDILPYDRTRVVLQSYPGIPGSDYINANYIRGASGSRAYIASQGPLPNTVPDFWRMVVECDVQVIIMASNETEGGKHKCECYWVEKDGEEKQFGNVLVSFIKSKQICPDFLVRTLKIKYTLEDDKTEERTICQFHYMLWPDHGVPSSVQPLLHMVRLVRDCQASETLPVLVHCSAGCGRTGTICAIDYVWGLLRSGKLNENLNLLDLVSDMRNQRIAMVQTREQYALLHQAVKELFRDRLSLIDSHPYENVATDGNPLSNEQSQPRESDYEELLLSRDTLGDNLKRSSSTSSLDVRKASTTMPSDSNFLPFTIYSNLQLPGPSKIESHKSSSKELKDYHVSENSSKTEKEAKNIAKKFGVFTPDCSSLNSYHDQNCLVVSSDCPTSTTSILARKTMAPSSITPKNLSTHVASNLAPKNLSTQVASSLAPKKLTPPVPLPRSRTPSPKRSFISDSPSNTSDYSRKPGIKTLKELFERSERSPKSVITGPNGKKLFRSASSVTFRPRLSVNSNSYVPQSNNDFGKSKVQNVVHKPDKYSPYTTPSESNNLNLPVNSDVPKCNNYLPEEPNMSNQVNWNFSENVGSGIAQRPRRDSKPALPVKKSKSFRFTRSPLHSKDSPHTTDDNLRKYSEQFCDKRSYNYHSLDRGRENVQPKLTAKFDGAKKSDSNVNLIPSQDANRLSVFESSARRPSSSCLEGINLDVNNGARSKLVCKPNVPPKKYVDEKFALKLPTLNIPTKEFVGSSNQAVHGNEGSTPMSAPPTASKFLGNKSFWDQVVTEFKDSPDMESRFIDANPSLKFNSSNLDDPDSELKGNHDYVNAQVLSKYMNTECGSKSRGAPIPPRREFKDKNSHDYANCNIFAKKTPTINIAQINECINPLASHSKLTATSAEGGLSSNTFPSAYEPVDFGETFSSVDEVFETLNYELIESKTDRKKDRRKSDNIQDYINKNLDSVAAQVYEDCQAYLLHGSEHSQVPSILPKPQNEGNRPLPCGNSSLESISVSMPNTIADLEVVKSKVSVPPQGLRNRERRNSYRQAVRTSAQASSSDTTVQPGTAKQIHKYEKIWFENDECVNPYSLTMDNNPTVRDNGSNSMDLLNNKLFKEKNAPHSITNPDPRERSLPDLSEEEMSSVKSGSTISSSSKTSQSLRSATSNCEPVYANILKSDASRNYQSSRGALPKCSSSLARVPLSSNNNKQLKLSTVPPSSKSSLSSNKIENQFTDGSSPLDIQLSSSRPADKDQSAKILSSNKFGDLFVDCSASLNTQLSSNKLSYVLSKQPRNSHMATGSSKVQLDSVNQLSREGHQGIGSKHTSSGINLIPGNENLGNSDRFEEREMNRMVTNSQENRCENNHSLNHYSPKNFSKEFTINSTAFKSNDDMSLSKKFKLNSLQNSSNQTHQDSMSDYETGNSGHKHQKTKLLLKKLKGTQKSSFKPILNDSENSDSSSTTACKDDKKKGSPRLSLDHYATHHQTFVKALGKFKMGSKNVAANFKSYLSSKNTPDSYPDDFDLQIPSSTERDFKIPTQSDDCPKIPSQAYPNLKIPSQTYPNLKLPSQTYPNLKIPSKTYPNLKIPCRSDQNLKISSYSDQNFDLKSKNQKPTTRNDPPNLDFENHSDSKTNSKRSKSNRQCL